MNSVGILADPIAYITYTIYAYLFFVFIASVTILLGRHLFV